MSARPKASLPAALPFFQASMEAWSSAAGTPILPATSSIVAPETQ